MPPGVCDDLTLALIAVRHPPQFSGMVPPLVLRMAMIMPTSNPLALAWEPATSNIPNAAWVLVMLHAPVRPSSGVGPGVAAATPAPAPLAASARAVTSRIVRALIGRSFGRRCAPSATEVVHFVATYTGIRVRAAAAVRSSW